ncbi:hypothetical protein [Gorillibacterium sp. sgz500922]|uniref:hypothetical protein n=1 Tax=Gorillibacterium sp. sgz500922 TaxID=3446694 RepID=UPI003F676620
MIKLLKYDVKRTAGALLAALAVLVIVEICASFIWSFQPPVDPADTSSLKTAGVIPLIVSLTAYGAACVYVYVQSIKSFVINLRSVSRRLLPLKPLAFVLSPILYCTAGFAVIGLLALMHIAIIRALPQNPLHSLLIPFRLQDGIATWLIGVWTTLVMLLGIFLLIALLMSFRFRGRVFVGIVLFTLFENTISMLEAKWFPEVRSEFSSFLNIKLYESDNTGRLAVPTAIPFGEWASGQFLFELAVAAAVLVATVWVIKHKLES